MIANRPNPTVGHLSLNGIGQWNDTQWIPAQVAPDDQVGCKVNQARPGRTAGAE